MRHFFVEFSLVSFVCWFVGYIHTYIIYIYIYMVAVYIYIYVLIAWLVLGGVGSTATSLQ